MIPRSTDGKVRVLSLSYGKDSMACLGAIEQLGWTLDRIVTADVWATDTIPADLPPMVEFKEYADKVIKERYGIEVEHYWATRTSGCEKNKVTYDDGFYNELKRGKHIGTIRGFPMTRQSGSWCKNLKMNAIENAQKMTYERMFYTVRKSGARAGEIVGFPYVGAPECNSALKRPCFKRMGQETDGCVQYLGIAADEPNRFHNLSGTKLSPLVEIGWTEAECRAWCEKNGLLSPIYTQSARGGCWFCHNQCVQQLRLLRKQYPDLWALLLKWDADSPVTFHADGHTVHDFDRRFQLEDEGVIAADDKVFRWSMLDGELNYRLF